MRQGLLFQNALECQSFFELKISDEIWGIPLIVLILAVGVLLTICVMGLQITKLPLAVKLMFAKDKGDAEGETTSFGALCVALSATIGTGNIVGVATAIVAGGPGALFWMWIAALFGTATKYAECLLAIKYRVVEDDGHVVGGPFYYIEKGMAIVYIVSAVLILVTHATEIPAAFVEIVESAFGLRAAAGGALGAVLIAMQKGIARGIFSNEAGLGSAPIAAASVKTDEPVEQGLVSMTGTVIDTLIICTMTGLSIVVTGTWNIW